MPARSMTHVVGLLAIVAASTPLALAVETGMRLLLFPPEFEELRTFLRPTITPWVWLMTPVAVVTTGAGFVIHRRLVAAELGKLPEAERTPEASAAANFDALMLSTSAPQVPALLSVFAFMLGSELLPVCAAIGVATIGVLSLGLALRPHAAA